MESTTFRYKPTMVLHVIWHPSFVKGKDFANIIYNHYCRDISQDIVYRKPGIPVFFNKEWNDMRDIETHFHLQDSKRNAIVVLVDDNMVASSEWSHAIENLWGKVRENPNARMFPVSLSNHAFQLNEIGGVNFIRLHQDRDQATQEKKLLGSLSHELCRMLLGRPRVSEANPVSPVPITLFLSHSKQDGEKLSVTIRNYIHSETALKSFFDANDIAPGYEFESEIGGQMGETALLVIHTDSYASREWCRKEVIKAKLAKIPIVVVDVVTKGEGRSFPYLGNVPTIRWNGSKKTISDIIDVTLLEVLRDVYIREHLIDLLEMYGLKDDLIVISNHPELFNFVNISKENGSNNVMVLYPEPPIGYEELHVLRGVQAGYTFITATMLPLIQSQKINQTGVAISSHNNIKIGLSISKSFDLGSYGLSETHLEDAISEFARYLLVNDSILCYGGDLRPSGFTNLLYDLIKSYFPTNAQPSHRIHNFSVWPLYLEFTTEQLAGLRNVADFHLIEPPAGLDDQFLKTPTFATPDEQVILANSFSKMREEMNNFIDVRLALGGQVQGFKGKYPGILEEVLFAMQNNKPTYLLGGYGGCTKAIIDAICGCQPDVLSTDFQLRNEQYRKMYEVYNSSEANGECIDYENVIKYLNQAGIERLRNGLSIEENLILFRTPHIPEMISLVLKGLSSLKNLNP